MTVFMTLIKKATFLGGFFISKTQQTTKLEIADLMTNKNIY